VQQLQNGMKPTWASNRYLPPTKPDGPNTPGVTIGLGDAEEVKPASTMPVFGVADFDASRTALEQAGVKFDGDTIEVEGMVKVAAFFDPDGNALMIAQDLST
jgi:predicted enzyme related to lactoylglutathione lyase